MALFCCPSPTGIPGILRRAAAPVRVKLRIWIAFAALCLLSGSGWLLREWQPDSPSGLLPIALRSGLLAIAFWAANLGLSRSRGQRLPAGAQLPLFGWAVLMSALPTVAVVCAGEHISSLTETFVFALVPVFVIFFLSQSTADFGVQESPLRLLAPALAGVAGAALLLPARIPDTDIGRAWLVVLLVAAGASGFAAIQLHERLAGAPVLPGAVILATSVFLFSAPLGFAQLGQLSLWSASAVRVQVLQALLADGPETLLIVLLLRELPPVAFSSRYLLVIAVTIAEGYLLLQPQINWTTALGMLLLLISGAWLLAADLREVT